VSVLTRTWIKPSLLYSHARATPCKFGHSLWLEDNGWVMQLFGYTDFGSTDKLNYYQQWDICCVYELTSHNCTVTIANANTSNYWKKSQLQLIIAAQINSSLMICCIFFTPLSHHLHTPIGTIWCSYSSRLVTACFMSVQSTFHKPQILWDIPLVIDSLATGLSAAPGKAYIIADMWLLYHTPGVP